MSNSQYSIALSRALLGLQPLRARAALSLRSGSAISSFLLASSDTATMEASSLSQTESVSTSSPSQLLLIMGGIIILLRPAPTLESEGDILVVVSEEVEVGSVEQILQDVTISPLQLPVVNPVSANLYIDSSELDVKLLHSRSGIDRFGDSSSLMP